MNKERMLNEMNSTSRMVSLGTELQALLDFKAKYEDLLKKLEEQDKNTNQSSREARV